MRGIQEGDGSANKIQSDDHAGGKIGRRAKSIKLVLRERYYRKK